MNCVLFAKMDQVFSKENQTLKKYWKIGEKYWKSQGILSVRKSGNPVSMKGTKILNCKMIAVHYIQFMCYCSFTKPHVSRSYFKYKNDIPALWNRLFSQ